MTERPSDAEQAAIPEDIATLYSRAHMQGTRYWDFSASRKEVRGQFRHRTVQEPSEPVAAVAPQPLVPLRPQREEGQGPQSPSPPQPSSQPSSQPSPRFEPPARSGPVRVPETAPRQELPTPRAAVPQNLPAPPREMPAPREAGGSRWYAMHSVFSPSEGAVHAPELPPQISADPRPPMLAVFSLAGGVGKTSLVATLGRALSALGEKVLLADTATCGLLPFYFGSREFKPGVVRTFASPGAETDAPVSVLNLEAERFPGDGGERDALLGELVSDGRGASRILVDIATASRDVTRRLLLLRPTVLVPLVPDMSSLASLAPLDAFLTGLAGDRGPEQTLYLLNQFDVSSSLHLDVREMLQQRLGDRLLPFVLRRSASVSEALAEGMTVIDYAPGSAATEDYWHLAGWLRSFAAPAAVGYGGVRWSER
jgi:cellulose synthase operon protein YhjQ